MQKYRVRYLEKCRKRQNLFYDFEDIREIMEFVNSLDIKETSVCRYSSKSVNEIFLNVKEEIIESDKTIEDIKKEIKTKYNQIIITKLWIQKI